MRHACARQHELQRFLGRGLADRAGDRDHLAVQPRACRACQIAQAFEHVIDHQQRRIGRKRSRFVLATHRETGAVLQRGFDEIMAVAAVARDRKEGIARLQACGCRSKCRSTERRQRALRAIAPASRRPSPRRVHSGTRTHRACCPNSFPQRRRDRIVIAERQYPVADDLATFMALAGDHQHVAVLEARRSRSRIASPRSAISIAPGAARKDRGADRGRILVARIVVGDDHLVGLLGGDRAHHRPLAGIAIAAGAEHHDQPLLHIGAQRLERLRQAHRACAHNR